jgi:hypothetical protein
VLQHESYEPNALPVCVWAGTAGLGLTGRQDCITLLWQQSVAATCTGDACSHSYNAF